MAQELKPIVTGKGDFEDLITSNSIYVDKTDMLYTLIEKMGSESFFFLTRPRRFGKSLTLSTLKAIFEGKKELFKDLFLYDKYDFPIFPVINLSMSSLKSSTLEFFKYDLCDLLFRCAKTQGVLCEIEKYRDTNEPYFVFRKLLEAVSDRYSKKIVILIDEYDYPLLDKVEDKNFEEFRKILADFYSVLKDNESLIRFCFITGITRISHISIFSKLNNLINISDSGEFSSLCGFTEEELDKYFSPYFDAIYKNIGIYNEGEKSEYRKKVKEYYNGYRFSEYSSTSVYNPVSIGSFLKANSGNDIGFKNYWIDTGAMSTIRKIVKSRVNDLNSKDPYLISSSDRSLLEVANIYKKDTAKEYLYAYLFQCGYLTIKDSDDSGKLHLGYPNEEVSSTLGAMIINQSYGLYLEPQFLTNLRRAFETEDIDSIVSSLNTVYSSLPWQSNPKAEEGPFEGVFLTLLFAANLKEKVRSEESVSSGVSDIALLLNPDLCYIFELKVGKSGEKAINQIKEKQYYRKYAKEGSKIHLIGLNFDKKTRLVNNFVHEVAAF